MAEYYRFFRASILAVALSMLALPAHAACWQWSKTAAANATADPTINYAEGMSPSSVNDSARAMMARLAECRDDVSGVLATGGTSTAYTVTTNQSIGGNGIPATPNTGQMIALNVNVTNGISPTLRVDGGTVYPIEISPGVPVPAATMISGTPYTVMFNGTAWNLRDYFANPYSLPLGGIMACTCATAPNTNFVLPYGQAISRTVYAEYFAQVGTTYGAGDGTTTFNIPDLRGRAIAGVGNMGGVDAARLTSAFFGSSPIVIGNVGGSQSHTLTQAQLSAALGTATSTHNLAANIPTAVTSGAHNIGSDAAGPVWPAISIQTLAITTTITNPLGGNAHPIVQPTMVLNYILRIF